jgi:translocon-associated protein subunit alpha
MHRLVAYNSTVTVVEPASSIFDLKLYVQTRALSQPRRLICLFHSLFMYLILAAGLAGLAYLAYEQLSARYFPKPVVKRTKVSRSVSGTSSEKVLVATDGKGQGGYPASVQPYEEEWIPEHLIKKGDTRRRVKRGTTSDGEGITSGGEATSGAESEKKKAGKGKGKGKK